MKKYLEKFDRIVNTLCLWWIFIIGGAFMVGSVGIWFGVKTSGG